MPDFARAQLRRQRINFALFLGPALVLLAVALVVVLGQAPFSTTPEMFLLFDIKEWIANYPMLAGMRAILIGVAFGAIGISLRVLLGFDRPYME